MHKSPHENQWFWAGLRRAGAPYQLPDDEQEIHPRDWQHYMLRSLLRGNYIAPIAHPAHILDVGCETGRWLVEMAQEFPEAELVGVDLTLSPQDKALFPSNCHFRAGNVLNRLPFADASFDFVHQRFQFFAIPQLRWPQQVDELARVTRRSGWVELTEVNPSYQQAGPATEYVLDFLVRVMLAQGLDPVISQHIGPLLSKAGLKRVGISTQLVPVGNWGGRLGDMAIKNILTIVQEMKPLVVAQMQIASEDFDYLVEQMRREVEQYHTTFTFHIAYGQSP
jgi:ubiquinone/menaquinone biosynthesis C-methylase UbiE